MPKRSADDRIGHTKQSGLPRSGVRPENNGIRSTTRAEHDTCSAVRAFLKVHSTALTAFSAAMQGS